MKPCRASSADRSDAEIGAALKDEFLAIMAHELRHPLNLIAHQRRADVAPARDAPVAGGDPFDRRDPQCGA
jgi:signal transduction histidine kinase